MAWTAISASQTDANSPVDQTLMDAIRTDLDDLNTRLTGLGSGMQDNIIDDFAGTALNTGNWTWDSSGAATDTLTAASHLITLNSVGVGNYSNLLGGASRIQVRMTNTQSVTLKWRFKITGISSTSFIGWQDNSLSGANTNSAANAIGLRWAAASQSVFTTAKGGATTTSAATGNVANWQVAQIDLIQTGSALTLAFYMDGVQIGSTITTTNIPDTTTLRPVIGALGDGGSASVIVIDYFYAIYNAQPLSP